MTPYWDDVRQHLDQIRAAALEAVDPGRCVRSCLSLRDEVLHVFEHSYPLQPGDRIFVVGAGKAGYGMAQAVQEVLGDRIVAGVVAVPEVHEKTLGAIAFITGGHPIPSEGSLHAGKKIDSLLSTTSERDLVIVLISGGGSALLEYPEEGIRLEHLQAVNELLLRSGAPIQQINVIRRQLSRIKGGGLARMAAPAQTIALILSDVVGDPLGDIASGPTTQDRTTAEDALSILAKYGLSDLVLEEVIAFLREKVGEGSDRAEPIPIEAGNFVIGNLRTAAQAAASSAERLGFKTLIVSTTMQGEARQVGRVVGALLKCLRLAVGENRAPVCVIFGGETTVTVQGGGIGGRNQELALAAALELEGTGRVALMTLATDGVDGPTPAAGAIVTGETIARARRLGLDAREHVQENDSHSFFTQLGATVITGPTGTNVNDLALGMMY